MTGYSGSNSKGSAVGSTFSNAPYMSPITPRSWGSAASESQGSVFSSRQAASSTTTKTGNEFKRLTEKELQEKRANGICFRCDDKWVLGHRCRKKELSVI